MAGPSVFRPNAISCLRIPAPGPSQIADFHGAVFGGRIRSGGSAIGAIESQGGQLVTAPYPEGNLRVATFRDPAGHELGIWQQD